VHECPKGFVGFPWANDQNHVWVTKDTWLYAGSLELVEEAKDMTKVLSGYFSDNGLKAGDKIKIISKQRSGAQPEIKIGETYTLSSLWGNAVLEEENHRWNGYGWTYEKVGKSAIRR